MNIYIYIYTFQYVCVCVYIHICRFPAATRCVSTCVHFFRVSGRFSLFLTAPAAGRTERCLPSPSERGTTQKGLKTLT